MCGIAGILSKRGNPVSSDAILFLRDQIQHRGQNGHGLWFDDSHAVALAHARLSVLDLSDSAAQPMTSFDGRFVITYNGEIYNFLELASELRGLGYKFTTESDTEVILAAFAHWGAEMARRFNGMWALAIFDTVSGSLFLSRDRFGVKPLFYFEDDDWFIFASEAKAIHRLIPDLVSPNTQFLQALAASGKYLPAFGGSYLNSVQTLPAGYNGDLADGSLSTRQWYFLESTKVPARYADQVEVFRQLLEDATKIRMRSDIPVATCLSGGIDSSSIVSVVARTRSTAGDRSSASHSSFTAAFPGSVLDETDQAALVAEAAGMEFNKLIVAPPSPELLESAMTACDGPMPSLAFFPIWSLYGYIKKSGISVTLDGQGADEMLGGYYLGYAALRGAWKDRDIVRMRDLAKTYAQLDPAAPTWIKADWSAVKLSAQREVFQQVKRPLRAALEIVRLREPRPTVPQLAPLPPYVGDTIAANKNDLATALLRQFFVNPLPFLLHQFDRASAAHGMECRMPFMDYRLVQFAFSLPLESRVGHGQTKRILRSAMEGTVPSSILGNRRKTGFNAPFADWLKHDLLRTWACDTLDASARLCEEIFDARSLRDSIYSSSATINERTVWSRIHIAWWLGRSAAMSASRPRSLAA